jgi:hypothetical protein
MKVCLCWVRSRNLFYSLLDNSFDLKRSEIAFKTDDFYAALERVFGSAAQQLQLLFTKKLDQKIRTTCIVVQLSDFFTVNAIDSRNSKT